LILACNQHILDSQARALVARFNLTSDLISVVRDLWIAHLGYWIDNGWGSNEIPALVIIPLRGKVSSIVKRTKKQHLNQIDDEDDGSSSENDSQEEEDEFGLSFLAVIHHHVGVLSNYTNVCILLAGLLILRQPFAPIDIINAIHLRIIPFFDAFSYVPEDLHQKVVKQEIHSIRTLFLPRFPPLLSNFRMSFKFFLKNLSTKRVPALSSLWFNYRMIVRKWTAECGFPSFVSKAALEILSWLNFCNSSVQYSSEAIMAGAILLSAQILYRLNTSDPGPVLPSPRFKDYVPVIENWFGLDDPVIGFLKLIRDKDFSIENYPEHVQEMFLRMRTQTFGNLAWYRAVSNDGMREVKEFGAFISEDMADTSQKEDSKYFFKTETGESQTPLLRHVEFFEFADFTGIMDSCLESYVSRLEVVSGVKRKSILLREGALVWRIQNNVKFDQSRT
jgi:hypothetical protein